MEEQTQQAKKIWIVTAEPENSGTEESEDAKKGDRESRNRFHAPAAATAVAVRGVQVGTDVLQREMSEFVEGIGQMFRNAQEKIAGTNLELNEIELSVEISGKGEVKLLGSGGEAAAKGAVKLKFARKKKD